MSSPKFLLLFLSVTVTLAFASQISEAQAPDPKPKPAASISGHVMIDGKAASGIPIAAIAGSTINRHDAAAHAVTDNEGFFVLSGLTAGQYQIWTLTPGMIAEPTSSANYFPYYGSVKSIILGVNEQVANVDLKLIRGAVISGRVTNADNKPVVAERMTLQLLDANGNPRLGALHSTYDQMYETDDRGVYRVYGLPPGRYRISVGYDAANDGILRGRRYKNTFYPDPNDPSKAGIVELSEGDEANNIDIRVQTAPPTYAMSGHVIDSETGSPIARAGVSFNMIRKDAGPPIPGFILQTNDRGEFNFSGFSSGHYAVSVSSEYYGGNFYGDPVDVDVVDKDVTGIEIKTTPGLSLSGVVEATGLSVRELLALVPGLTVSVSGVSPVNNRIRTGGRAVVAPDGSFQVDGLRPGPASIFVAALRPSFVRATIMRIERDGIEVNQGLNLQQSVSGFRIVIDYGTGLIRGTVKFDSDVAIGDSRMYVSCKREGGRDGPGAEVDARGNFLIENLSTGTYEVTLQINRLSPRPQRSIPPQKQTVNVTNGSATEVNFVIDLTPRPGGP